MEVSLVPTKTVDGANLKITPPFLGETEITWNAWLLKKVVNIMCYFFSIFFFFLHSGQLFFLRLVDCLKMSRQ